MISFSLTIITENFQVSYIGKVAYAGRTSLQTLGFTFAEQLCLSLSLTIWFWNALNQSKRMINDGLQTKPTAKLKQCFCLLLDKEFTDYLNSWCNFMTHYR